MATIWLLDVDGVINARRPGWRGAPHHGYAYADGTEWPMRWEPKAIDRIRALASAITIRWCSTWCPHSAQLERLFRLPPLGVALAGDVPAGPAGDIVKLVAARAVLAAGDRLIWTDDTAVPTVGPVLDELTAAGALLIRPPSRTGLTPRHFDMIESFAQTAAGD